MNNIIDFLIVMTMGCFVVTAFGLLMKVVGFFYDMYQRKRG